MPLYSYQCTTCGAECDEVHRVADRRTHAPTCHGPMDIKLAPVSGYMQRDCNYKCPVTGEAVRSTRQRNNIMAKHDLRDANDYKSNFQRSRDEFEARKTLAATLAGPVFDEKTIKRWSESSPT